MIALHGFLGRPEDWDGVLGEEWAKPGWLEPLIFTTEDAESTEEAGYLSRLARHLNRTTEGDTLLGYSMGGRIALHMLLESPARWRRAVIVSASPGLPARSAGFSPPLDPGLQSGENPPNERETRRKGDENWAARFLHDDWDAVVEDWNAQPVFAHDPPERLPRREEDFDRRALAAALALGSVGRQADLREGLKSLDLPILWIAGAKDPKYAALAEECATLNPRFASKILDAGHRVPWSATDAFRKAVEDFTTIRP